MTLSGEKKLSGIGSKKITRTATFRKIQAIAKREPSDLNFLRGTGICLMPTNSIHKSGRRLPPLKGPFRAICSAPE